MYFLDTNILARFIVGDVESQQPAVQKIFHEGNEKQLEYFIIPEVIIELNYVLNGYYEFSKSEITQVIRELLNLGFLSLLTNYAVDFGKVVDLHQNKNLSLEDCLYLQVCLENKFKLITFDLKLKKVFEELVKG
jgi:predicted nucleic acid-binding protein